MEAAEAKAYYGLSINWKPLEALVDALIEREVLQVGDENVWMCGRACVPDISAACEGRLFGT